MEVLRLTPPPRSWSCRTNNVPDSPPSSPRHAFTMEEVEEAPLGEVLAAIPFLWELTPGTPKPDFEMHVEEEEDEDDDDDSSDEAPVTSPPHVSQLRLPPRLQHLSSCSSDVTSSKATMLCGFMRTLEEEVIILGMQSERKQHRIRSSLSPLRFLSSSEASLSRDSVSSSFSSSTSPHALRNSSPDGSFSPSSSFSSSTSPQAPDGKGRSLNDLVPDTSVAAPRESATRKAVESRSELLQKQRLDGDKMEKPSPPPATSIPSSLPSRPSRREHLGRALFANRLGLLCTCLGELPQSH